MLFVSPTFIEYFLPAALAIFYLIHYFRPCLVIITLLFISLFFCAQNGPWQTAILMLSIAGNFLISHYIFDDHNMGKSLPRIALIVGVSFNMILLGYFKYYAFLISNLNFIFDAHFILPTQELPVGISFYTFTQIAFLADIYIRRGPSKLDLTKYGLFVTYFPHVIAGPIIHWKEMMTQFERLADNTVYLLNSEEHREKMSRGLILFAIGLAKKVFIADQLSPIVDSGYQLSKSIEFYNAWITSLAFTFQLYFDFSGYSDMAIGISLLFGILLPINFNAPYRSISIQDFWRRWHMTLSRWLKDYIYIPLGGNKEGMIKTLRNLMVTFLLGGMWHGASWNFLIWGGLHGVACCINHLWTKTGYFIPRYIAILLTFVFVNFAWVFFRAPDLSAAITITAAMLKPSDIHFIPIGYQEFLIALSILFVTVLPTSQTIAFELPPSLMPFGAVLVGIVIVISMLSQNNAPSSPFLYFNF